MVNEKLYHFDHCSIAVNCCKICTFHFTISTVYVLEVLILIFVLLRYLWSLFDTLWINRWKKLLIYLGFIIFFGHALWIILIHEYLECSSNDGTFCKGSRHCFTLRLRKLGSKIPNFLLLTLMNCKVFIENVLFKITLMVPIIFVTTGHRIIFYI